MAVVLRSYQIHFHLSRPAQIRVGRLGVFRFPAGRYIYTGGAQRGLGPRISRHLRRRKKRRWHIDYLLASARARIVQVVLSEVPECNWNLQTKGQIPVPGLGASDCRRGCGSHLKRIGP